MSLAELTRNSFQAGIPPAKWINLVKLFLAKNKHISDVERELSDSVLVLFGSYPGEPTLQAYLRTSIQEGVLPIATLVTTFLAASRSPTLSQSPATLDMLCKVVLETHYASRMQPLGSLVASSYPPISVLSTIHDAMLLLKMAYTLPASELHHLTLTTSELLMLLLSCASDFSQLTTGQAMSYFTDTTDLLQIMQISPALRHNLETFTFSLSLVLGDDSKVAREAQMMHPIQMSLGSKTNMNSGSEHDTITFSLFFHHIVMRRAKSYGSGDGVRPAATLVALLRWMPVPPTIFYTQILISCATCLSQLTSTGDPKQTALWRAFIIGRLPRILVTLGKTLENEGVAQNDLRQVTRFAFSAFSARGELLAQCDATPAPANGPDSMNEDVESPRPLIRELLEQCNALGLIEHTFAASIDSSVSAENLSRTHAEAHESGISIENYLDGKLGPDASFDDVLSFLERLRLDYRTHAILAQVIHKRFTSLVAAQDVESLSHLSKILYTCEWILDIISLHIRLSDLIGSGLAFLDEYDCETVGDPQTALSHLGDVVLFLQWAVATYHLGNDSFLWEHHVVQAKMLEKHHYGELSGEEGAALGAWAKALFDSGSEGIEDGIIRSTKPKILCRIAAVLFSQAISACSVQKIDTDVLNNGVSYFLGPLLNWTLVGVVKALVREIQLRGFAASIHLEVLQTLLNSPSCPRPVPCLCAQDIIRVFADPKTRGLGNNNAAPKFDPKSILAIAYKALGVHKEDNTQTLAIEAQSSGQNQNRLAIREALRGGKAPCLDVDRCLLFTSPTKFLNMLWTEMNAAASVGNMDICKRVATHVLVIPASTGTLPLLPVFIHVIMPALISGMDNQQTEQNTQIELLVSILSSSLSAAFHTEWAWRNIGGEQRYLLGQSSLAMARGVAEKLRKKTSPTSRTISTRLAACKAFASNFPMVMGEL